MNVLNRRLFKRNARNALNRTAGIPNVATFSNGGITLSRPPNRGSRTIGTTSGISGLPPAFSAPKTGMLTNIATKYISGKPLSASEFSVLKAAEQGFLSRQGLGPAMGEFGKTGLGGGIQKLLDPAAETAGQLRGFTEGALGTAAQFLLGSPDGASTGAAPQLNFAPKGGFYDAEKNPTGEKKADYDKRVNQAIAEAQANRSGGLGLAGRISGVGGPQLSQDFLKSLDITFMDPTNLQTASSRGGAVPPSAFGKAVPPPAGPKPDGQIAFEQRQADQRRKEEAIARGEMDRIGSVVGNEEGELTDTGFLPTTTPSLESAADNVAQAVRQAAGQDVEEEGDDLVETQATIDDDGEDDATPGKSDGTTATDGDSAKKEIDRVINSGTKEEQEKTLDGFIKEFMDKAPGYEGADSGLILAKIGFSMAAGKSPNAIENIASALSSGADMLIKDKAKKDEFNRQLKLSALQYGVTETSKISAEERAVKRADADVVEMVVGAGGTRYKDRDYAAGESVFISKGDLKAGSFPPNILGTSGVTALKNQLTANTTALKNALDLKKISPAEYTKKLKEYSDAVTTAIDSESGMALLKGAMVTVTDGNVTGIRGVFKDAIRGGGAFLNMDLSKEYGDKKAVRDAMRAALQDVIPVTLGATQTANSISNRDVDFLIEAYFGAGALNGGTLTFAAETETDLVRRLQRAITKMENSQKRAFSTMRSTEQFLTPLYQPGTTTSASGLLSEDQRRLQEAGLMAGGSEGAGVYIGGQRGATQTVTANRGDDGIIRYNLG